MEAIVKKQIQLIKMGQRQLCIDDDTYRDMLQSNFGVRSCTQLSHDQASKMINLLVSMGVKIKRKARGNGSGPSIPRQGSNIVRLANKAEKVKISALLDLLGWKNSETFRAWMQERFGFTSVKTANDAFLVIEGLKKVFENRMKKDHGRDWWLMNFNDGNIARYVQLHRPAKYAYGRVH